jgi:Cdc6-like AAA superfamily ATPase
MDLTTRIRRRRRHGEDAQLVLDYDTISPVSHVSEPTSRGPALERLLDYLDPVFDGEFPPDAYVWGPAGAGKSAIVTALFSQLEAQFARSGSVIHTATRAGTDYERLPAFVYVDARSADSEFGLYHAILDAIVEESVPKKGVGTDALADRLGDRLTAPSGAIVAVDHVDEPETYTLGELTDVLEAPGGPLVIVAIGRVDPADLNADLPPERIEIPAYRQHALVDILTSRASEGVAERAVEHEQIRELARWAEGNAHDALAALFGAADRAATAGRSRVHNEDLNGAIVDIPRPCVPLGRVLTLQSNRQRVLRALVDADETARASVESATEAVAAEVDLSPGTVKRFLYELAENGILERVREDRGDGHGRPPSRVEPRFPTDVFRRLYDLADG